MNGTIEREHKGVSINPMDFSDAEETKESRRKFWEPLIVLPRDEAIAEMGKIDARIDVIRYKLFSGSPTDREWKELGAEWGRLLRKSGSIMFGSIPGAYWESN